MVTLAGGGSYSNVEDLMEEQSGNYEKIPETTIAMKDMYKHTSHKDIHTTVFHLLGGPVVLGLYFLKDTCQKRLAIVIENRVFKHDHSILSHDPRIS